LLETVIHSSCHNTCFPFSAFVFRAVLKVHHPLHPLTAVGKPAVLERQIELCVEAGAGWVKDHPSAPTTATTTASSLNLYPEQLLSKGNNNSSGGESANGDAKKTNTSTSNDHQHQQSATATTSTQNDVKEQPHSRPLLFEHLDDEDDHMEESDAPPVVWLLWVSPPEELDTEVRKEGHGDVCADGWVGTCGDTCDDCGKIIVNNSHFFNILYHDFISHLHFMFLL
jgi:hypothetical protein